MLDLAVLDLHDDHRRVLVLAGPVELDGAVEGEERVLEREAGLAQAEVDGACN